MNRQFPTCRILTSTVSYPTQDQVVATLGAWIECPLRSRARQVVVTGFHGLWEAHSDPAIHAALNSADLWIPDGIAPVLAAQLRGLRGVTRTPGAEIMLAFLAEAGRRNFSSFFYGDTEETLLALRRRLQKDFPNAPIAGMLSPPFGTVAPEEDRRHIEIINASKPDVLWVGLGTPKQDRWIHQHRSQLEVPVALGVGAAFRFLAGTVKRCPAWVGNAGLEWLWRLCREPAKLWRRDFTQGPRFLYHMLRDLANTHGD